MTRKNQQIVNRLPASIAIVVVAFVANLTNQQAMAQLPVEGTNPVAWRVLWTFKPSTHATISWNTAEPSKTNTVTYWEHKSKEKLSVSTKRDGQYSAGKESVKLYYHHAILENLKPDTKYRLIIESGGKKSKKLYFITASDTEKSFSLLSGGDSRSNRDVRQNVNRFISKHLEMEKILGLKNKVLAFAHGGDYVASGKSLQQWKNWMSDYELTSTSDGRLLPIIPARGNHDVGPLFNEIFNFDPKHQNHYAVVINESLALITLNTETTMAGNQAKWLNNALKYSRPRYRWLLAQYHTPAYPAYKRAGGALQHFVPLFEKYNVDLVLESDGHTIKRTVPIRKNKFDRTGIVYVGEGGLGVTPRVPKTDRWYIKSPGKSGSGHHVQLISFSKKEMVYQVFLPNKNFTDSKVFDTYSFKPRKK